MTMVTRPDISFDHLPRFPLATLPTPLQEAVFLRAALGGPAACPRILIKRDDLTGLALGGNKARKLEFLVGEALKQGASVLVTSGAVQSNHARMTAAAARAAGLDVTLVLSARSTDPPVQGNLLLDHLLGATIHLIPAGSDPAVAVAPDEEVRIAEVVDQLTQRGEHPYLIPVGGSTAIGALGYVTATKELVAQLQARRESPTRVYFASGSRGTHAGLALGRCLYQAPYRLCGVAVSGGEPKKAQRALAIANGTAALLNVTSEVTAQDVATDQTQIGPGYALPSAACIEAIKLVARTEGLLLDPVYTGKAMAALIDHVRRRAIDPSETVMFLHTGGSPGLFAAAAELL